MFGLLALSFNAKALTQSIGLWQASFEVLANSDWLHFIPKEEEEEEVEEELTLSGFYVHQAR